MFCTDSTCTNPTLSKENLILAAHLRRLLCGRNPSPTFRRMLDTLNDAELLELHTKHQEFLQERRAAKRASGKAHVQLVKNRLPNLHYQRCLEHIF
ncbi:MAG: hypothetical protein ACRDHZ_13735 [Ktedonobacteraceae bacterium]